MYIYFLIPIIKVAKVATTFSKNEVPTFPEVGHSMLLTRYVLVLGMIGEKICESSNN